MPESYPLFLPPGALAAKSVHDFTKHETDAYFHWLLSVLDERVNGLLSYLGERITAAEETLLRVGQKVAEKLNSSEFSQSTDKGPDLTDRGYALAADVGLLLAKLFLQEFGGSVHWSVVRKPKTDVSYNSPVLEGFGKVPLNPLQISITQAFGILTGKRVENAWCEIYRIWKRKLLPNE